MGQVVTLFEGMLIFKSESLYRFLATKKLLNISIVTAQEKRHFS